MGTSLYEQFQREQAPQQPSSLYDQYRREQSGQPSEKPGLLSRVGEGITNALAHPIDTAMNAVVAPIESAFEAAVSPGVGESRPDARLSKGGNSSGRAIDTTPYDAQHGGITNKERTAAGIQSVANAAAPSVFGPLAGKIGNMGALATTGAAEGAAYNPDDPAAGALTGALVAPALGAVTKGAVRGSEKVADVTSKVRRIRNATATDESVAAMNDKLHRADAENYGRVDEEAKAAGGTSPAVQQALDHPIVKPLVEKIRASEGGTNADDATVLQTAKRMLSKKRRALNEKNKVDYDDNVELEINNLTSGLDALRRAAGASSTKPALTMDVAPEVYETQPQVTPEREPLAGPITPGLARDVTTAPSDPTLRQALRDFPASSLPPQAQGPKGPAFQLGRQPATVKPGVRVETPGMRIETAPAEEVGPVMPSLAAADATHAKLKGERKAFNTAVSQTRRVMRGSKIQPERMDTQGKTAFLKQILDMDPEQAQAALDGTLGAAKDEMAFKAPNPHATFFGTVADIGKPLVQSRRAAPLIDALDRQAGNPVHTPVDLDEILKYFGLTAAQAPPR